MVNLYLCRNLTDDEISYQDIVSSAAAVESRTIGPDTEATERDTGGRKRVRPGRREGDGFEDKAIAMYSVAAMAPPRTVYTSRRRFELQFVKMRGFKIQAVSRERRPAALRKIRLPQTGDYKTTPSGDGDSCNVRFSFLETARGKFQDARRGYRCAGGDA